MTQAQGLAANRGGHGLLCPTCKVDLLMSDRQGIEIDYCPQCRGVWLDRGELDKIIEGSLKERNPMQPQQLQPSRPPNNERLYDREYSGHGRRHKSFLERIFD